MQKLGENQINIVYHRVAVIGNNNTNKYAGFTVMHNIHAIAKKRFFPFDSLQIVWFELSFFEYVYRHNMCWVESTLTGNSQSGTVRNNKYKRQHVIIRLVVHFIVIQMSGENNNSARN